MTDVRQEVERWIREDYELMLRRDVPGYLDWLIYQSPFGVILEKGAGI